MDAAALRDHAHRFLALRVSDPWRPRFNAWATEQGLSQEQARAVCAQVLRERVVAAAKRHQAKAQAVLREEGAVSILQAIRQERVA